ncbi:MAG: sulfatase-like hydrolase/transferase [Pirellulaceae bacterium]
MRRTNVRTFCSCSPTINGRHDRRFGERRAIRTPTLDALVERGFVFHSAYYLGSNVGAVCSPSRNMLMTGQAYFRWNGRLASPKLPNLPATMKQAGYFTHYHHGKRGNTATAIQAFIRREQVCRGQTGPIGRRRAGQGDRGRGDRVLCTGGQANSRCSCIWLLT